MRNRIFPNWQVISALKQPLTQGEVALAEFLDQNLPPQWEIYVQPYLNGDKPDLVILNPAVGLVIFEVKDWNLQNYSNKEKWHLDKKHNKRYKTKEYYVHDARGSYQIQSPIIQVEKYRQNLINLYLPQIGDAVDSDTKNLAPFKVAVYFHCAVTDKAQSFLPVSSKRCVVFGYDSLNPQSLSRIVIDVSRSSSYTMTKDWANSIKFWLYPPFHALEQGKPIQLTSEQARHTKPSPHKHQRLRGVAGSGKTLVIAQRAANIASQSRTKKILIVTFNITLLHYIKDNISRARFNFHWNQFEFRHFHGFCADFLRENGVVWPTNFQEQELFNQEKELFNQIVPELVIQTIKSGKNKKNRQYDAIIIDEGQDFQKNYYDVLCEFLSPNDELLLVVDEIQNIFQRELSWLNAMEGTRFRGRWRELKQSYRLPVPILEQANKFIKMFLPNQLLIPCPKIQQRSLFEPHLKWEEVYSLDNAKVCIHKTVKFLAYQQNIHPQDIIVLVPSHKEGWELVQYFQNDGIQVNHVFEDEAKSHNNKKSFWMGDGRLKMSTIHSFKGWELLNVIILTPTDGHKSEESLDSLLYVAITRPRQNLVVFNRYSKYRQYGQGWIGNWYQDDENDEVLDDIPF